MDIEKEAREIEKELAREGEFEDRISSGVGKAFKTLIGAFLVILVISYILIDPDVREVIVGFFESQGLEGNSFNYGETTITFEEGVYSRIRALWEQNQEQEIRACLGGKIEGNTYLVDTVILPEFSQRTVYRVVSGPCPEGTIIDLHTHPYRKCVASGTDLATLQAEKEVNPGLLMAVMCEEDRMSFYG